MRILGFDTETASLQGGVCDIAIAQIDADFNVLWESESLVDPERPISPDASGIHHITDDMVTDAPTLAQYMAMNGEPFDDDELFVFGHNVQFDCRMVAEHLPQIYRKVCTLKLARLVWPDAPNHKLQTLRYLHKLDAGQAHRAMGDVTTCLNLLRLVAAEKQTNFWGLVDMMKSPLSPESKLGFGNKHREDKIKDVPLSYIRWMLDKVTDLDPDLRAALMLRVK